MALFRSIKSASYPAIDPRSRHRSLLKKKDRDEVEDKENVDNWEDVDLMKKFDEKEVKPIWSLKQELSTRQRVNEECLKQKVLSKEENDEDDKEREIVAVTVDDVDGERKTMELKIKRFIDDNGDQDGDSNLKSTGESKSAFRQIVLNHLTFLPL